MPVAKRLAKSAHAIAYGGSGPVTGPVIAGCTVTGQTLELRFNITNLRGDTVVVQSYNATALASAMEVMVNGTTPRSPAPGVWINVQIAVSADAGLAVVAVNLTSLNGSTPLAVRYAWGDSPCCLNFPLYPRGDQPCLPASCPIMGKPSDLPAMPFVADIVDNRCRCRSPQQCDG